MKNKVQNTAIVVLTVTAILLFVWTAVQRTGFFGGAATTAELVGESRQAGPLMPVCAVINNGETCSLLSETRLLTPYFDALRPVLVELLGSAADPTAVTEAQWCDAIGQKGVLLDYGAVLPIAAVRGNAESQLTGLSVDSLLISLTEELAKVYVYADGVCYVSTTALKTGDLETSLLGNEGRAVCYAYTLGDMAASLTPHSAVPLEVRTGGSLMRTPLCDAYGSYERERQALLLEAFGFDSYTTRSYADASSGRVFLAENGTLRAGGDGSLTYVATEGSVITARTISGDSAMCVNTASVILSECISGLTNAPRYVLSAVETDGDRTTASFDAWYDGAVLVAENGSRIAARFVFDGEQLVQAEISLFTVTVSEADVAVPTLSPQVLLAGLRGDETVGRLSRAWLACDGKWSATYCVLPNVRGGNGAGGNG
ncbi:MAG: hypothetical protein IKU55_05700 [Clostridia bacterium]|nr:hypothetical protein [Clostridia bacterium]